MYRIQIHLFLLILLQILQNYVQKSLQSTQCPQNCQSCKQNQCIQCNLGYNYLTETNECYQDCEYGQYYDQTNSKCVSICPYSNYNQDTTKICDKLQQCPQLKETGSQYFDIFTNMIEYNDYVYTSGTNTYGNDFSIKIFDNQNGNLQGYLQGHSSHIMAFRLFKNKDLSETQGQNNLSLFSFGVKEIIEWDLQYIKQKSFINFSKDYYLNSNPYIDDQIVILNRNETQFGVLYYRQLQNSPNYFKTYPSVHKNKIIGYLRDDEQNVYSYGRQLFVKYKDEKKYEILCNFEFSVTNIQKISSSLFIIILEQNANIQVYSGKTCSDLSLSQNEYVKNVIILNKQYKIIIVQTLYKIKIIKISQLDQNTSQMYVEQELGIIDLKNQIIYAGIYDFQQKQIINNYSYTKYLVILNQIGTLKICPIADFIIYDINSSVQWIIEQNSFDIQLQTLTNVNNILIYKAIGNIIISGKGLYILKSNFQSNKITNVIIRKNLALSQKRHTNKINGIIADPINDRIISYSEDGSFMIWQESIMQSSGMPKIRFILQQYHPKCDLNIQSVCPYPVQSVELPRNDLIITKYVNENVIYLWNYQYDAVWLNNTYSLSKYYLPLNNYLFYKKNQTLSLCNQVEVAVFNIATSKRIYTFEKQKYSIVYGIFVYSTSKSRYQNILYMVQKLSESLYEIIVISFDFQNQVSYQIINQKSIDQVFFVEDTWALVVVGPLISYILERDFYIYILPINQPSAFAYEPISKNFVAFQKNLEAQYQERSDLQYTKKKTMKFSVVIDKQAISTAENMYFFYQNTPVEQIQNQIYVMRQNLDVQMVISFQNKISSLTAVQKSQKIYVGFENGDIQSGFFATNYTLANKSPSNYLFLTFTYLPSQNRIYIFDWVIF